MSGKILISTAYLPPVEYFSLILDADEVLVEREENYLKQSYRNRCYILSANGPHSLTIPVYLGSLHKTAVKEIRIDYSKRWQQVHLRAINTSYRSSPFFEFYFEDFEKVILKNHEYLMDLNTGLTEVIFSMLRINKPLKYTSSFIPPDSVDHDYRYRISPKKSSDFILKEYTQVFTTGSGFVRGLSIIDLLFNMGPDSSHYLKSL
ncbi:MAG: WbqC family protein [Bacteroidales bacterium]|nr:WbqC family protein [Bacteroidales bacterium]